MKNRRLCQCPSLALWSPVKLTASRSEITTLKLCGYDYHHHNHHHHWHNSPFWAKAFFRSFCQLSLFLAAFLHFLSPNFLASSITPSSHLSFSLPLCLLPSTTATRTLRVALCSSIRITCPAHFNRLILMYVTISLSLYNIYNSLLYFILHSPLSLVMTIFKINHVYQALIIVQHQCFVFVQFRVQILDYHP